jgi:ubiquinone biosynthesis protein COQ9
MTNKKDGKDAVIQTREAIVMAALHLAAQQGWEQVTFYDVAQEVNLSLAELFIHCEDKFDILAALGRMIDRKMLEGMAEHSPETSTRDALFDILMDRFEILNENRDGITAILQSFKFDPKQAVISLPHLCRSMSWILESAQINTNGIRGAIKVSGMTGIYLKVLKVWMRDDSPDLSKTMAALDKELERAEQLANTFGF